MLRVELIAASSAAETGLRGSGLIVVNPPWTLHDELNVLLPALARRLSRGATCKTTKQWIADELSR
jgi:23S rRNA (adenine2030-N6)-methyltransferase